MMARWPDGSLVSMDPQEIARDIQRRHPGWTVWWGRQTRMYGAEHRGVPALVMTPTPDDMVKAIDAWGMWLAAGARR